MKINRRQLPDHALAIEFAKEVMGPQIFFPNPKTYLTLLEIHAEKLLEAMRYAFELGSMAQANRDEIANTYALMMCKDALFDSAFRNDGLDGGKGEKVINIILGSLDQSDEERPALNMALSVIQRAIYREDGIDQEEAVEALSAINAILYKPF